MHSIFMKPRFSFHVAGPRPLKEELLRDGESRAEHRTDFHWPRRPILYSDSAGRFIDGVGMRQHGKLGSLWSDIHLNGEKQSFYILDELGDVRERRRIVEFDLEILEGVGRPTQL